MKPDAASELLKTNAETLESLGHPQGLLSNRTVDFNVVFPSLDSRALATAALAAQGYAVQECDDGVDAACPELLVNVDMMPTAEAITRIEVVLADVAAEFGGWTDGWGFMSDTVH